MKYFLQSILKLSLIIILLTWERVLGLPLLFVSLSLLWLDKNFKFELKYFALLILLSLFWAVVYQFSWLLALLLLSVGSLFLRSKLNFFPEKKRRVLVLTLILNLILIWVTGLELNAYSLIQLTVSYLLVLLWLRLIQIKRKTKSGLNIGLLDEYGF